MNWNRLPQEIYESFFVVFGFGVIGAYWLSYLLGSHDGIMTITPGTALSACWIGLCAMVGRIIYRMYMTER